MTDILVRGLAPETVKSLKDRAKRNNRSLQAEVRDILERQAYRPLTQQDVDAFLARTAEIRKLAGPQSSNSTEIIRRIRNADTDGD